MARQFVISLSLVWIGFLRKFEYKHYLAKTPFRILSPESNVLRR